MDGANEIRMLIDIHGHGEGNEQSTAWRQQIIFASEFADLSDLMEHQTMQFKYHLNFADGYLQCINPNKNTALVKLRFPNVEGCDCSDPIESEDMFESRLRNYQEPVPTVGGRPRYTMDNFLNGRGSIPTKKSGNEDCNTVNDLNRVANRDRNEFYTAREVLALQNMKNIANNPEVAYPKSENNVGDIQTRDFSFGATKKKLGSLGRISSTNKKSFVPPVRGISTSIKDAEQVSDDTVVDLSHVALKNIDSKMVEVINNEIMHQFKPVDWGEIAGLVYAKSIIKEAVIYPFLRPDLFTGLRRPPRGILLFGPPGTGKTLIGKCIASQSKSTFFSISSASLTSKWMGEGEKMVRALFAVAVARQPSVIFMDEIDSLLSKRSENENEGTRRLKTEFLVRLDGAATSEDDRVLIVGATNRPQELDDAVRRRFVKRLYVPLPELDARIEILTNLLKTVDNNLNLQDLTEIANLSEGYSGADMDSLCREASMEPLRSLPPTSILTFSKDNLRPVNKNDFYSAIKKIRPSVSKNDLDQYVEWNTTYGSSY